MSAPLLTRGPAAIARERTRARAAFMAAAADYRNAARAGDRNARDAAACRCHALAKAAAHA